MKNIIKKQGGNTLLLNQNIVYFDNEESAIQIIEEIYGSEDYFFITDSKCPMIIDAGSNIGISVLFFKQYYPSSNIICFEADPNAFNFLKKNIKINSLEDVALIHSALSGKEGEIDFHGQFSTNSSDARGNSILPKWGCQRRNNQSISVKTKCLSSYLTQPIDCLKIDIEGAEQQVLEEAFDQLHWVKNIVIEIHSSKSIEEFNDYNIIVEMLKKAGFDLSINKRNMNELLMSNKLPLEIHEWIKNNNPELFLVKGTRRT